MTQEDPTLSCPPDVAAAHTPVATHADGSVVIESLDLDGRGIARREGKVIFVEGALPGERVMLKTLQNKQSYEIAEVSRHITTSSMRVKPRCPHFGECGGCAMQHLDAGAQVAVKQRVLEDTFAHIGKIAPQQVLAPIHGPSWGYRFRARLSVRYIREKNGMRVGFRERKSSNIADMRECHTLPPHISDLLMPLRFMLMKMKARAKIPQLELAVGDSQTALVLRHMVPLVESDIQVLRDFGTKHAIHWWLQPRGPESVHPLDREDLDGLSYTMPEFGLRMPFKPTDFTQVNHAINRVLVSRALMLLDPQPEDRVADLFCGLGNFTLALATRCREVVGVEGSQELTDRALEAARRHGLQDKTSFSTLNLFEVDEKWLGGLGRFDRMVLDPPRDGALAVSRALVQLGEDRPRRLVYVSCNPATLARDAAVLVEGGYKLSGAGVVNMFPHTGHVESIAVFNLA